MHFALLSSNSHYIIAKPLYVVKQFFRKFYQFFYRILKGPKRCKNALFLDVNIIYYSNFFFFNIQTDSAVTTTDTTASTVNPIQLDCPGTQVFIPQMLAINVGIEITSVIDVNNFITLFASFDITEAYPSVVVAKMLL